MSHDHFHIIRVRTTAVEWFVLTARDVTVDEAKADPLVGQSERDLRARLSRLGFPETEVEVMFRAARQPMTTITGRPEIKH